MKATVLKCLLFLCINAFIIFILLSGWTQLPNNPHAPSWEIAKDLIILNIALLGFLRINIPSGSFIIRPEPLTGSFKIGQDIHTKILFINNGSPSKVECNICDLQIKKFIDIDEHQTIVNSNPTIICNEFPVIRSIGHDDFSLFEHQIQVQAMPRRMGEINGLLLFQFKIHRPLFWLKRKTVRKVELPFSITLIDK